MMKNSSVKWILAISLIINVFLIGAAISTAVVFKRYMHDFQKPIAASKAWRDATEGTTKEQRIHIYMLMKTAALTGEHDMAKARAIRAQAVDMVSKQPYDAVHVAMLSEQARSAENDARAKIENAMILNMKDLPVRERTFLATTLLRSSTRFNRFVRSDDTPPPANKVGMSASAQSAASKP
ncbi:MAG: periplasmic heavy metal sensor [Asticcacaulis sp.]